MHGHMNLKFFVMCAL